MNEFLSELAESKLLLLSDYLVEKWGLRTRDRFFQKLNDKIHQISKHPDSFPKSIEVVGLYKCVVTKHTTKYYRLSQKSNEIEIITIFDSR